MSTVPFYQDVMFHECMYLSFTSIHFFTYSLMSTHAHTRTHAPIPQKKDLLVQQTVKQFIEGVKNEIELGASAVKDKY